VALDQIELLDQRFGNRASAALGEDGNAGVNIHSRRVVGAGAAILVQAHIADTNALDRAGIVVQRFRRGESRENIDPQCFRLRGQPGGQLSQRNNVITVIVDRRAVRHALRQQLDQKIGERFEGTLGSEYAKIVFAGAHLHARILGPPLRQQGFQGPRFEDRARQGMRAYGGGLFQDANRLFGRQLFQTNRTGKSGRPSADDRYLVLHDIALAFRHQLHPPGIQQKMAA
jgi:hypothetical protein